MNIIEKLGIVPAPWEVKRPNHADLVVLPKKAMLGDGRYYFCFGGTSDVAEREAHLNIVATAPEMLDELIKEWQFIESYLGSNASRNDGFWYNEFLRRQDSIKNKILKATNKSWEEIKELIG